MLLTPRYEGTFQKRYPEYHKDMFNGDELISERAAFTRSRIVDEMFLDTLRELDEQGAALKSLQNDLLSLSSRIEKMEDTIFDLKNNIFDQKSLIFDLKNELSEKTIE